VRQPKSRCAAKADGRSNDPPAECCRRRFKADYELPVWRERIKKCGHVEIGRNRRAAQNQLVPGLRERLPEGRQVPKCLFVRQRRVRPCQSLDLDDCMADVIVGEDVLQRRQDRGLAGAGRPVTTTANNEADRSPERR
jgi:hypothetical protein